MDKPRPLYEVFLERVIKTDAVQCHRAAVIEDHAAEFFNTGRRPTPWGDYCWSLDAPGLSTGLIVDLSRAPPPLSPPLQAAWDAAEQRWQDDVIVPLRAGQLIATATHPTSGLRRDLEPAEFTRAGLALDVRNGDLLDANRQLLWTSLVVLEADHVPAVAAAAQHGVGGERTENKEKKQQLCKEAAAVLIAENPPLESMPTTVARRVEQRCLHELQKLGHKKTKNSYKTVARYLRQK